jgi:peptide subunit release factor 1 (eRF1)
MFDERALKELASIQTEGPILSVYLNVDPTQRTADEYKLKLREILRQVGDEVDKADTEAVRHHVDYDYDWSGRGLVLFSRAADDIWYAYSLEVPVRSGAIAARRPYISPLVELDGLYGRYVVALVDRQGGKFYTFQMGELTDSREVEGEDVRRARKGRGSSVVGMRGGSQQSGRHEAELVNRNLKETASALNEYCQRYKPRRLLLAGADHTVAQFLEVMPSPLRELYVGAFTADIDANEVDIRESAFELLEDLESAHQQKVVDAVVTSAAKGQNGVIGLDGTMSVAHEGRIQVLVVDRDYHQSGYRCGGCGYLTTQALDTCVFCGGQFQEIPDAVEAVVTQVVEQGGTVEVVDEDVMAEAQIGALLRY